MTAALAVIPVELLVLPKLIQLQCHILQIEAIMVLIGGEAVLIFYDPGDWGTELQARALRYPRGLPYSRSEFRPWASRGLPLFTSEDEGFETWGLKVPSF